MSVGRIYNIERFTLHDGPGIRTTVFFKGCPLRCQWCSNPESQSAEKELSLISENCTRCGRCVDVCPRGALSLRPGYVVIDRRKCDGCGKCAEVCRTQALELWGRDVSVDELLSRIARDKPFYENSGGGVTFSGGEVFSQTEFLVDVLKACTAERISTAIQTSCYTPTTSLDEVIRHTDLIIADIKHMDDAEHRSLTGVGNELILRNIRHIAETHPALVIQLPLIPGLNDSEENIVEEIRFISSLPRILGVSIVPYHQLGASKYRRFGRNYLLSGIEPPDREYLEKKTSIFRESGLPIVAFNG